MIGIPVGLLYANASEWLLHRYVLHAIGKRKESYWSFHWHDHHRASRKEDFYDASYEGGSWRRDAKGGLTSQGKESLALVALSAAHLPLLPIAPFFTATVIWSAIHYHRVHRRSHLDPEWAREHLPWHYDHHMGPDQNANWCVSFPWFDHIMGTRKRYLGTKREQNDAIRRKSRGTSPRFLRPQPTI